MTDPDDDVNDEPADPRSPLRDAVRRAMARGLFVDVPCEQPFGDNEEQMEFESLIPGAGRLLVELWSEGQLNWRAAASWMPWRELRGQTVGEWMRAGGDGLWARPQDAVVEALCAIAPCAAMTPLDLIRRREPSSAELAARAHALRLCSDGRLTMGMAQLLVAQSHGFESWDDVLRTERSYGLGGR
jgi:hypothetical protein